MQGKKRLLWSKGKIKMRAELGGQERTMMGKKKGEWRLFRGLWEWRGYVAGENGRSVEMGGRRRLLCICVVFLVCFAKAKKGGEKYSRGGNFSEKREPNTKDLKNKKNLNPFLFLEPQPLLS